MVGIGSSRLQDLRVDISTHTLVKTCVIACIGTFQI